MPNLICRAIIDSDANKILLSGLSQSKLEISMAGDIDFTPFVSILTELIDKGQNISFESEPVCEDSEKSKLVIKTIREIIGEFNTALNSEEEAVCEESMENEDLPF